MADSLEARKTLHSYQSILEVGAKLLALIATLCVALSVVFDWGYLTALELTFSEVPTSLSDHTRSAVLWLPLVVSVFPLAIVASLFSAQLDAKDMREAKSKGEDIATYIKNDAKNARWLLAIFSIIGVLLWLAFGYRARSFLVMAALAVWVLVVVRATPHDYLGIRLSMFFRFSLVVLPIIPFGLYMAGYNSGREGISPDQQFGTITVRGSGNQYQLKANVVRIFEKTAIVVDGNRKALLLKPDDIVQVEKAKPISINKGVLCDYWRISCPASNIHVQ